MRRALAGAWHWRFAAGTLFFCVVALLAMATDIPVGRAKDLGSVGPLAVHGPAGGIRAPQSIPTAGSAGTTTSLTSAPNPSEYGQPVAVVATVVPATASGFVSLFDGANSIGSLPLVGGIASTTVSNLVAGLHSLIAVYDGDVDHEGSIGDPVSQVVQKAQTTSGLVSAPNPSLFGQTVSVVASVVPSTATGFVTFYDAPTMTILDSLPLVGGMATTTVASLAAGVHVLFAQYAGDSNMTASSATQLHVVELAPSITSGNSSTFVAGIAGTFTVHAVGYPTPAFLKSGALPAGIAFVDLGDGTATLSGMTTLVGTYPMLIAATNGISPSAIQAFTLIVNSPPPPVPSGAVSRKVHGAAGTFDLQLSPGP